MRRLARREPDRAAAARMFAIANALEGMTRAEAARLAGMERQALRDAVVRYNAEGLAGLHDRPRPGSKPRLDEAHRAALRQLVLDGPEVEATGVSAWTLAELCREVEARWGVRYHEGHMSKLVRGAGPVTAEGQALASQGGSGRTGGVRKRGLQSELDRIRPSTLASA